MYTKYYSDWQDAMKPMADLATINAQAWERLVKTQMDFMSSCFDMGMSQINKLSGSKDMPSVIESQNAFVGDISKKVADVMQDNMKVLSETNEAMAQVMESAVQKVPNTKKAA